MFLRRIPRYHLTLVAPSLLCIPWILLCDFNFGATHRSILFAYLLRSPSASSVNRFILSPPPGNSTFLLRPYPIFSFIIQFYNESAIEAHHFVPTSDQTSTMGPPTQRHLIGGSSTLATETFPSTQIKPTGQVSLNTICQCYSITLFPLGRGEVAPWTYVEIVYRSRGKTSCRDLR
jgi:hypothetical protein